jgi:signal peptidase I
MAENESAGSKDIPEDVSGHEAGPGVLVGVLQAVTGPWTKQNLLSWLGIILLVLFIKGCVVDQYTIPTGSMEPTLIGDPRFFRGDRVLVKKWVYGPRIPFTTKRLWRWGEPDRWDIVVFHAVDPNAKHPILIKRVVGLPGEHVLIREGKIWINGESVTPPGALANILHYTNEPHISEDENRRQFLMLAQQNKPLPSLDPLDLNVQILYAEMEKLHAAVEHLQIDMLNPAEIENLCVNVNPVALRLLQGLYMYLSPKMQYGVIDKPEFSNVPENHYLLLGDNSEHSMDGRMFGWVPHNHLYGHAFAVWWPWSHRKDFTGFSHTWWGMTSLYGIPVILIGLEMFLALRRKT